MRRQPAPIHPDVLIARCADRQDGVVARGQLLAAGVGAGAIDRRVRLGRLTVLHRGVYVLGSRDLTRRGLWRGALLAEGDTAALSLRDAGASARFVPAATGPVSVTVPGHSTRSRRGGIDLHRAPLRPGDVLVRDGIRVTSPARTLLDLAAVLPTRELERALDEAHYRNGVSARTLAETLERNRGRPGVAALRAVLAHHELGSTRTETQLEETFLRAFRATGRPLPRSQVWIGQYRVDFLWPAERVIVEVDGPAHRRRSRQSADATRDKELEARGYEVVRIDEAEVYERPDLAVQRALNALSARRPSPAG